MKGTRRKTLKLSHDELFGRLHTAYPLIDSALIAAMLSDINEAENQPEAVDGLLDSLELLTLQAKTDYEFQIVPDDENHSSVLSDGTSNFHDNTGTSATSSRSINVDTPLAFLTTAFPDHSPTLLQKALMAEREKHVGSDEDIDMEVIVQDLLSREFIAELEERGLDEAEAHAEENSRHRDWTTIATKQKGRKKAKKDRDKRGMAPVVSLGDVQQRQQRPPPLRNETVRAYVDPWTHLSSLASRLSELLPPLLASHFLSLFHRPDNVSPAAALRQELKRLSDRHDISSVFPENISLIKEIARTEAGMGLDDDAETCLGAASGDMDTALELVWLLVDMDEMGPAISHTPITRHPSTSAPSSPTISRGRTATIFQESSLPLSSSSSHRPSQRSSSAQQPQPWTKVAHRPPRRSQRKVEEDPLAQSIPAYKGMPAGWRAHTGRPSGEPDLNENLPEDQCRYWSNFYQTKRDEALQDASRYWKKNWAGSKGGDVALVYAEDSREHDRRSKAWALKAARVMVSNRQRLTNIPNAVDLHGLTVSEAISLSREATGDWWNSAPGGATPSHSLTIITGVGNHSKNRVGVIGPAVQNALEGEGWRTSKRPGAIVVSGAKNTSIKT